MSNCERNTNKRNLWFCESVMRLILHQLIFMCNEWGKGYADMVDSQECAWKQWVHISAVCATCDNLSDSGFLGPSEQMFGPPQRTWPVLVPVQWHGGWKSLWKLPNLLAAIGRNSEMRAEIAPDSDDRAILNCIRCCHLSDTAVSSTSMWQYQGWYCCKRNEYHATLTGLWLSFRKWRRPEWLLALA
jgi:hypothetical protein